MDHENLHENSVNLDKREITVILYTGSAGVLGVVYLCNAHQPLLRQATPLRLTFTV